MYFTMRDQVRGFQWTGEKRDLPEWILDYMKRDPKEACFETPQGSEHEEFRVCGEYIDIGDVIYEDPFMGFYVERPESFFKVYKLSRDTEERESDIIRELERDNMVLLAFAKSVLPLVERYRKEEVDRLVNVISAVERVLKRRDDIKEV